MQIVALERCKRDSVSHNFTWMLYTGIDKDNIKKIVGNCDIVKYITIDDKYNTKQSIATYIFNNNLLPCPFDYCEKCKQHR